MRSRYLGSANEEGAMEARSKRSSVIAAGGICGIFIFSCTAPGAAAASEPTTGELLTQNFQAQHEIGHRFHIAPADLPEPKVGPIVTNRPLILPFNGQTLQVPKGFVATPFATGLVNPRRLLVLSNGD